MLLDLSHKYPAYKIHDRERKYTPGTSGKLFSQSLDEAVWAIDAARAFLVASVEMTLQERLQIEKKVSCVPVLTCCYPAAIRGIGKFGIMEEL